MTRQRTESESEMTQHRGERTIIKTHDAEALDEGCTPVAGSGTFVKIVGKYRIYKADVMARMLKTSYAPVVVGRKPVPRRGMRKIQGFP